MIDICSETDPAPPDERPGRAVAGPGLRERGGERQEDADGSGPGLPVHADLADLLHQPGQPASAEPQLGQAGLQV